MRARLVALAAAGLVAAAAVPWLGAQQGGGTIDVFVGSTPTPSGAVANLWVDTNGGTCTRSASRVAYVDAAACSDAATAYAAASAGDLVYVKAKSGGYAQIAINNTKTGAAVTIQNAPGETVEVAGIAIGTGVAGVESAGALVLDGFQSTAAKGVSVITADNVTMRNIALSGFAVNDASAQKGIYISNTDNLTFQDFTIGPWGPEDAIQLSATYGNNSNLTFNRLVEFDDSRRTATVPSDFHNDCMDAIEIDGLTIKNSRYWSCGDQGWYLQGGGPNGPEGAALAQNILIEDSVIGSSDQLDPIAPASDFHITDPTPGPITIRNSTFLDFPISDGVGAGGAPTVDHHVTITGSIFAGWSNNSFQCSTFFSRLGTGTTTYNVIDSTGCGLGATNIVDTTIATKITNPSGSSSSQNAHLLTGASAIDVAGFNLASGCATTDIDGASRPNGTLCDAGADEYGVP